jgi:hypothetical protein
LVFYPCHKTLYPETPLFALLKAVRLCRSSQLKRFSSAVSLPYLTLPYPFEEQRTCHHPPCYYPASQSPPGRPPRRSSPQIVLRPLEGSPHVPGAHHLTPPAVPLLGISPRKRRRALRLQLHRLRCHVLGALHESVSLQHLPRVAAAHAVLPNPLLHVLPGHRPLAASPSTAPHKTYSAVRVFLVETTSGSHLLLLAWWQD